MQVRLRGKQVHILASTYQRYDKQTNSGGRSQTKCIHKFSANATEIPPEVRAHLNPEDIEKVMQVAILPARAREQQRLAQEASQQAEEARYAIDPNWRVEAAIVPLNDALGVIEEEGPSLDGERLGRVIALCTSIGLRAASMNAEKALPVAELLISLAASTSRVAQFVAAATFPSIGHGNMKESPMYKAWSELSNSRQALQSELQHKGYVQTRKAVMDPNDRGSV